ncbi:MAG TPA: pitrilysin family protein [Tepidisphaeraceae bacterium]|jgi:zinc protease
MPSSKAQQRDAGGSSSGGATGSAAPSAPAGPAQAKAPPPAQPDAPATRPSGYGNEEYRLVEQPDEIISRLKNGAVVIAKRVPSPVVAVRGYVYTGGVYEGPWLGGGLSHLLEHLVAGGSSVRRSEAENRDLLQRLGNNSNAYTTTDHTAYFINTTPEHMAEAVDLVTGWMLGALITPEEYRREYEVVQRELEKDKGEPDWVFWQLTQQNRYRVSPAGVPVIGYQEVIRGLSRDDVYNYYKLAYQPNNMVFSVSGDLEPKEMLAAMTKYLDDAAPGRVFTREIPDEPPVLAPRTLAATFPKLGQARLEIGFPSVRLTHEDMYALDLLATVLGNGESSILVEELRDKRRLVNNIMAADSTPSYVEGTFLIDMELDPKNVPAATEALLGILDDVIKNGVATERLHAAKVQMRANRVKSQQTSEDIAASLATDLMSAGDPHFQDRYVKRIEAVTAQQIQQVAKKYFLRDKMITTAMLPTEYVGGGGLPKAEDLLRKVAPTTQTIAQSTKSSVARITLGDGTVLLHKRISTSPLVVMQLYSLGGLTTEEAKTNGLGNLTMQMLPRGTKTRSAQQIAEFFDSIGGDLTATCGSNSWFINATCMTADFDKTFDVYADIIKNPSFPADELNPMKQRISAQIEGIDADWNGASMKFFKKAFFGPKNSPYQFMVPGTIDNVKAFTPEQCAKWYSEKVIKAPRVLAIYGDIALDQAQAVASRAFGSASTSTTQPRPSTAPSGDVASLANVPKAQVNVERVELNKTELPVAGVIIGYDANTVIGQPSNFPLDVGDTMTSGWGYPTGYLHEILRGQGLVYVVHAQSLPGRSNEYPGTFLVYAGCDPSKVNEVVDTILENIARLQGSAQAMNQDWFTRSKQLINTSEAMNRETPAEQAQQAALDELYGLGYDYRDHYNEKVNAVTLDQVRGVAAKRLTKAVVTVTTPDPDSVKIKTGPRTYNDFPPVDLTPRGVQHDAGGK